MELTQEQIQANILKLKNKMGDARTGGKGSQRRKVKVVNKQQGSNDKVIKGLIKKTGAQPLGVDQVNFFKDDNTVMHFRQPQVYASIQSNTFIVSGDPQTKTIKDLLPDIIQQLGPKQHKILKDLVSSTQQGQSDDAPELVETTKQSMDKVD